MVLPDPWAGRNWRAERGISTGRARPFPLPDGFWLACILLCNVLTSSADVKEIRGRKARFTRRKNGRGQFLAAGWSGTDAL